jgi:hypothetical protein
MRLKGAIANLMLGAGMAMGSVAVQAENIGVAQQLEPNPRAKEVTMIMSTLLGKWKGTYNFFDERALKYVGGAGTLVFTKTPMPNVIMLDAVSERPSGPPVHALTVMVMQADGASLRQMVFREADGRIQDKLITGYSFTNARNWRVDSIEVQQGLGLASAVDVAFVMKDGHLEITKRRKFEGGEAAAREYESRASFDRVD